MFAYRLFLILGCRVRVRLSQERAPIVRNVVNPVFKQNNVFVSEISMCKLYQQNRACSNLHFTYSMASSHVRVHNLSGISIAPRHLSVFYSSKPGQDSRVCNLLLSMCLKAHAAISPTQNRGYRFGFADRPPIKEITVPTTTPE